MGTPRTARIWYVRMKHIKGFQLRKTEFIYGSSWKRPIAPVEAQLSSAPSAVITLPSAISSFKTRRTLAPFLARLPIMVS